MHHNRICAHQWILVCWNTYCGHRLVSMTWWLSVYMTESSFLLVFTDIKFKNCSHLPGQVWVNKEKLIYCCFLFTEYKSQELKTLVCLHQYCTSQESDLRLWNHASLTSYHGNSQMGLLEHVALCFINMSDLSLCCLQGWFKSAQGARLEDTLKLEFQRPLLDISAAAVSCWSVHGPGVCPYICATQGLCTVSTFMSESDQCISFEHCSV